MSSPLGTSSKPAARNGSGAFFLKTAILSGGAAIGAVVAALLAPVISRLVTPDQFGLFTIFVAYTAIPAILANWRYELAISLPEENDQRTAIVAICAAATLSSATLVTLGFWAVDIMGYLPIPSWSLPFVFATVLAHGIYETLNRWAIHAERVVPTGVAKFTLTSLSPILQICLLIAGIGASSALIMGYVGAKIFSGLVLIIVLLAVGPFPRLAGVRLPDMIAMMRRYKRFPLITVWSSVANAISSRAIILFLSFFLLKQEAGEYGMAMMLVATPALIIGQALGQIFLSRGTRKGDAMALQAEVLDISKMLLLLVVPASVVVFFAGPTLINYMLGAGWEGVGFYAKWMVFWLGAVVIVSPATMVPLIKDRAEVDLQFQITLLVVRLGILVGGSLVLPLDHLFILFFIVSGALFLMYGAYCLRLSGLSLRPIASTVLTAVATSLGVAIILMIVDQVAPPYMIVPVAGLCLVLIMSLALWRWRRGNLHSA